MADAHRFLMTFLSPALLFSGLPGVSTLVAAVFFLIPVIWFHYSIKIPQGICLSRSGRVPAISPSV
jgi:uncharacterized membrane protein YtjA (UPF0391 family)